MKKAKKTWRLYSKERGFYMSDEPGRYAAVVTQKIAGCLDCHSGKRALPENRIFLRHLGDMPRGFRPCRICHPEKLRVGDGLDYLEKRAQRLERQPHVSLWASAMIKPGKDEYEACRWYAALNWSPDGEHGAQHTLSKHHRYQKALSLALQEGQRLNLPVIKHMNTELVIMWLPTRPSNAKQKELVCSLQSGKVRSLFGNGVIVM